MWRKPVEKRPNEVFWADIRLFRRIPDVGTCWELAPHPFMELG